MNARRSLALRRDTLTALEAGDLSGVVGAAPEQAVTSPLRECVVSRLSPATCSGPPGSTQCPERG